MKLKLSDKYPQDFVCSQNGNIFKKDVVTELDVISWEEEQYLKQKILVPVDPITEEDITKLRDEKAYDRKQQEILLAQRDAIHKHSVEEKYKEEMIAQMAKKEMAAEEAKKIQSIESKPEEKSPQKVTEKHVATLKYEGKEEEVIPEDSPKVSGQSEEKKIFK